MVDVLLTVDDGSLQLPTDVRAVVAANLGNPATVEGAAVAAAAGTPADASTTVKGIVELATSAETITGSDTVRAVTPAGLHAKVASETAKGLVELATAAETVTGTDTTRATHAAGVAAAIAAAGGGPLFADPNADRIAFWDDSAGAFTALVHSAPLSISGTSLTVSSATSSAEGIVELATTAEVVTGTDTTRAVTAAGVTATRGLYVGINAQTGTTYAPVLTDQGKLVTLSNAGAITVTMPSDATTAFPIGTQIDFTVIGAGMATFVAGGSAFVNATPSAVTRAQYSAVTAIKRAANTWILVGDLA
jgi:hypothetical protein